MYTYLDAEELLVQFLELVDERRAGSCSRDRRQTPVDDGTRRRGRRGGSGGGRLDLQNGTAAERMNGPQRTGEPSARPQYLTLDRQHQTRLYTAT